MKLNRTITLSVYVVYKNKVLLRRDKRYNTLFPLYGKINEDEVPHETAIREVYEKSELEVQLYNGDNEIENIAFIYFARALTEDINLQKWRKQRIILVY